MQFSQATGKIEIVRISKCLTVKALVLFVFLWLRWLDLGMQIHDCRDFVVPAEWTSILQKWLLKNKDVALLTIYVMLGVSLGRRGTYQHRDEEEERGKMGGGLPPGQSPEGGRGRKEAGLGAGGVRVFGSPHGRRVEVCPAMWRKGDCIHINSTRIKQPPSGLTFIWMFQWL